MENQPKPGDLMEFLGCQIAEHKHIKHPIKVGEVSILRGFYNKDFTSSTKGYVFDHHPIIGPDYQFFADHPTCWRKVPDDRASNWKINIVGVTDRQSKKLVYTTDGGEQKTIEATPLRLK